MNAKMKALIEGSLDDLHSAILNARMDEHPDLEQVCFHRIARIERTPLSRDGRWWHFPNATSWPFGH